MPYCGIPLKNEITVSRLFSLHYYEYMGTFHSSEDFRDSWELIYVDKGEADILRDGNTCTLKKDEVIFYAPGETHEFLMKEKKLPNLMLISFSSKSPAMEYFRGQILHLNERERAILGLLLFEAKACFSNDLSTTGESNLRFNLPPEELPFGSQQLIRLYLEQFLLLLQRRYRAQESTAERAILFMPPYPAGKSGKKTSNKETYDRIVNYMLAHIDSTLTIEQICHDNLIGRSQLQKLFQEQNCCGIIHYFSTLKIEAAKQYIRDGQLNFTQISEALGFSTIHYFSRQFKRISGMTPSEYALSVKRLSEQE